MEDPSQQRMLILNVDEHGNQSFSYEDGSGTKRLHLGSDNSEDNGVDGLGNYILDKRIKMEQDDEVTAVLIQGNECEEDPLTSALTVQNGLVLEQTGDLSIAGNDPQLEDMNFNAESGDDDAGILMQHMDIREPLSTLKHLLERRLNMMLSDYDFWLQDAQVTTCRYFYPFPEHIPTLFPIDFQDVQLLYLLLLFPNPLEAHKNLVDQCVQGEGMVQVNVQIKVDEAGNKKINIVDVLKPAEEFIEIGRTDSECEEETPTTMNERQEMSEDIEDEDIGRQNIVRWIVDNNFKRNQIRLNIPQDPNEWDIAHVRHWLLWAVRQFNLTGIKLTDWKINGAQLCNLSLPQYRKKVPHDPGDFFWTHLELLRKCKFVAVVQNPPMTSIQETVPEQEVERITLVNDNGENNEQKAPSKIRGKPGKSSRAKVVFLDACIPSTGGNRSGNNGQIQLWQFLLELLTDKLKRNCIQWLGSDGEFKLINPENVARLWGIRKNKPTMNYEKLSRALRYYYDGDMISKVHGKRFVYKFVCDLKHLLGYSASELNSLVMEAERRYYEKNPNTLPSQSSGWEFITNSL